MIADIEELEQMDASEIHARRLNAKEVSTLMKHEKIVFPVADGTVKIFGGDRRPRPFTPLSRDCPEGGGTSYSSRRIRRTLFCITTLR